MLDNIQVVILAGGKGSRLMPLTEKIPKSMVKINGVPFLEIILRNLKSKGINRIVLCVGYLSYVIEDYFHTGQKLNLKISYSHENQVLGTAGAIKNARKLLENEFIVLNGDTFVEIDLEKFVKFSQHNNKICTITGFKNHDNDKDFCNNLLIDKNYRVLKYTKDEKISEMDYVDAGVYYCKREIMNYFNNKVPISLEYDVFSKLIKDEQMICFPIHKKFHDIGNLINMNKFKEFCQTIGLE